MPRASLPYHLNRQLRRLGIQIVRFRDPYIEASELLGKTVEHTIDGGAYRGKATSRMLDVFPRAIVHAFEPQPAAYELIQRSFGHHPRVRLYRQALSDSSGSASLHITAAAYTTSLLEGLPGQDLASVGQETVDTVRLDEWWSRLGGPPPAFIKLDLQGYELRMLRGASRLLDEGGVRAILTEVNFRWRYSGQCFFHEVASFLHERRFLLYRLYEVLPDADGGWRQADALFVRQ